MWEWVLGECRALLLVWFQAHWVGVGWEAWQPVASLGLQKKSDSSRPLSSLCLRLQEIDTYIVQAKERSYETMLSVGKRGLNIAATAAVQAATKVPWAPALQQPLPTTNAFWASPALCQGAER